MKKYYLRILFSAGTQPYYNIEVIAWHIEVSFKSSMPVGCYSFYCNDGKLIGSYPIERTIIYKVEDINE
jgi:hypothetical protein